MVNTFFFPFELIVYGHLFVLQCMRLWLKHFKLYFAKVMFLYYRFQMIYPLTKRPMNLILTLVNFIMLRTRLIEI